MTVRSIDLQVLLPKIAEANRSQPIQNQQSQTEQQQFAAQFQKKVELQKQQVLNSSKSEGSKIGEDNRKSSSGQEQRHKEAGKEASTEDESKNDARDPRKGKIFDIKI